MSEIVVAIATTTVFIDSQRVHIAQGSAWAADSPAVLEHPDNFSDNPDRALGRDLVPRQTGKPAKVTEEAPVEQKTAAPGEKANTRRGIFGR